MEIDEIDPNNMNYISTYVYVGLTKKTTNMFMDFFSLIRKLGIVRVKLSSITIGGNRHKFIVEFKKPLSY
jgi:hypothetical protein